MKIGMAAMITKRWTRNFEPKDVLEDRLGGFQLAQHRVVGHANNEAMIVVLGFRPVHREL